MTYTSVAPVKVIQDILQLLLIWHYLGVESAATRQISLSKYNLYVTAGRQGLCSAINIKFQCKDKRCVY